MRVSFPMNSARVAVVAAVGAMLVVGFAYDVWALENELEYQHRLMACIGMYEVKSNLSRENPRAICERAAAATVTAELN